jgi:hypothetical protein
VTPVSPSEILRELAADGAWTQLQLRARLERWGAREPSRLLARTPVALRPTAFARRTVTVTLVQPSEEGQRVLREMGVRPQRLRPAELEHALGLAELRWRIGAPADRYRAQDALGRDHRAHVARGAAGLGPALADGIVRAEGGVVLCEYDHGRYTARQVREKLAAFGSSMRIDGQRVLGSVWGAPTETRREWLRGLGVRDVLVLAPETWLG